LPSALDKAYGPPVYQANWLLQLFIACFIALPAQGSVHQAALQAHWLGGFSKVALKYL